MGWAFDELAGTCPPDKRTPALLHSHLISSFGSAVSQVVTTQVVAELWPRSTLCGGVGYRIRRAALGASGQPAQQVLHICSLARTICSQASSSISSHQLTMVRVPVSRERFLPFAFSACRLVLGKSTPWTLSPQKQPRRPMFATAPFDEISSLLRDSRL